eukprot:m.128979 g.128979  ORF g.128979 m.128979 type:complete len:58 (-) comp29368_c0_seq1:293-466(-)
MAPDRVGSGGGAPVPEVGVFDILLTAGPADELNEFPEGTGKGAEVSQGFFGAAMLQR